MRPFPVQPEWRIELIAKAVIHSEIPCRAPSVLSVERVAADVVINFRRRLQNQLRKHHPEECRPPLNPFVLL